jgi:hypothetical protein
MAAAGLTEAGHGLTKRVRRGLLTTGSRVGPGERRIGNSLRPGARCRTPVDQSEGRGAGSSERSTATRARRLSRARWPSVGGPAANPSRLATAPGSAARRWRAGSACGADRGPPHRGQTPSGTSGRSSGASRLPEAARRTRSSLRRTHRAAGLEGRADDLATYRTSRARADSPMWPQNPQRNARPPAGIPSRHGTGRRSECF